MGYTKGLSASSFALFFDFIVSYSGVLSNNGKPDQ